ncbi:M28 family peptidase [Paraflavitalea sp. CAU 1676]|uniref:M28 family peptidase n=1 Tax=Paraflavitalea sp. CAU 1676 TaxID=3032598 RepID=UPI0023DBEE87|nr:M28 family peptidase [Paraflavitalea sp. CAU 1676]MDF2187116.1 M20/M25/M40 family metallo-hydrolase [Paraflavitalea sp. CAU 1676]
MMKKYALVLTVLTIGTTSFAQKIDQVISEAEVARVERTLSADDMQGRAPFTPGIDKAAAFIAEEFKKAGLKPVNKKSYLQSFDMLRTKFLAAKGTLNGKQVAEQDILGVTNKTVLKVTEASKYTTIRVPKDSLYPVYMRLTQSKGDFLLLVDTGSRRLFNGLKRRSTSFAPTSNIIALLTMEEPATYDIEFTQEVTVMPLNNVVGILPGKSKKNEYVIFSGHYDHLGIAKKANAAGDSIYNGANDDAAGTTAVIMLAHYFAQQKDNERTIVFAAFTAEESGGFGAQYFSRQFEPAQVMAMFNIEMIGTDSKWGDNSAYITGYDKTDMGKILEKNLEGTAFKFYPDPYPDQQLFYRSDNATLARLGVPAHTISTSKMDSEKFYHTLDDEFETLNMRNMTEIIKAIALSSTSIVAGKDTPSRVDTSSLR